MRNLASISSTCQGRVYPIICTNSHALCLDAPVQLQRKDRNHGHFNKPCNTIKIKTNLFKFEVDDDAVIPILDIFCIALSILLFNCSSITILLLLFFLLLLLLLLLLIINEVFFNEISEDFGEVVVLLFLR